MITVATFCCQSALQEPYAPLSGSSTEERNVLFAEDSKVNGAINDDHGH